MEYQQERQRVEDHYRAEFATLARDVQCRKPWSEKRLDNLVLKVQLDFCSYLLDFKLIAEARRLARQKY